MKFERTPQRSSIAIYAFLVIAASIVFASLWINLGAVVGWVGSLFGYVMPVVYGLVLAFLFSPLLRLFDEKLLPKVAHGKLKPGLRRGLALALTYLVVFVVLAALLLLVLPQLIASLQDLIRQISLLVRDVPQLYARLSTWVDGLQHDGNADQILRQLLTQATTSVEGMLSNVGTWLGSLVSGAFSGLTGLASSLSNWGLGIIISIYILSSHERLIAQVHKVMRAVLPERANGEIGVIARDSYRIFSSYLAGAALDASIVGIICILTMTIFGWQYAVLTGVVVALSNMIPFFGPFIGGAIGVLLQLSSNPWHALGFLVFILIMQQVDGNILNPRIVGSNVGLPPLWVVFAILLFGGLMGIVGMLIGVPLFAVLFTIARRVVNLLLQRKSAPTDLREYDTAKNQLPD